ncbi:MAG: hypothetical protein DRI95_10595 [Bacteroidetes bacterium]|nr:MAG: hypothetical protein DRI95_10595 [Bacteroidota bacterium]
MKDNILKPLMLVILISLTIGLSANNQCKGDRSRTPKKIIQKLDTNKDGKLSKEEASKATRGPLSSSFISIDSNSDGYIDASELTAYHNSASRQRKSK